MSINDTLITPRLERFGRRIFVMSESAPGALTNHKCWKKTEVKEKTHDWCVGLVVFFGHKKSMFRRTPSSIQSCQSTGQSREKMTLREIARLSLFCDGCDHFQTILQVKIFITSSFYRILALLLCLVVFVLCHRTPQLFTNKGKSFLFCPSSFMGAPMSTWRHCSIVSSVQNRRGARRFFVGRSWPRRPVQDSVEIFESRGTVEQRPFLLSASWLIFTVNSRHRSSSRGRPPPPKYFGLLEIFSHRLSLRILFIGRIPLPKILVLIMHPYCALY